MRQVRRLCAKIWETVGRLRGSLG